MRKEVQFKAVSAFIFFAGVLFGFNDASIHPQYMPFQDGRNPFSEDHQYHSNAVFTGMPFHTGHNGMTSSPPDNIGYSHETNGMHTPREVNGMHSAGELNGVPYYTGSNTYGPAESSPSFIVQASYGRNPDDALHHVEVPQSPYCARNPTVIYVTRNPNGPCLAGKSTKVSPVNGELNFRTADESEPSGETKELVPRLLLRHLFPSVPKRKRYHYARRTKDSHNTANVNMGKNDPHKKRFSRLARIYRFWRPFYKPTKDNPREQHDKVTRPPHKNKAQYTSTENEIDQPYVSPGIITPSEDNEQLHAPSQPYPEGYVAAYGGISASPYPPEDDEQLHTPSRPYPDAYSGAYGGTSASPYPPEVPPEPAYLHYPLSSPYPDDPEPVHIHLPSSAFYPEEQPHPDYPQYSPSPYYTEEQSLPDYLQYPTSLYYPGDPPYPYLQYPPSSYYLEDQPHPYHSYPPSPYYPEDEPPHSFRKNPSSPDSAEEQPRESFRQFPPWPYVAGQTETRFPPQNPSSYLHSDDLGFTPFPMFPFFSDDLGFPFFPPFPFFSDKQDPSSLSRPQSSPYFAGSFASSQYPTSILYTTTSRPSSNNRKAKSRVIASTLPDTEIVFTKTLFPDSEDHTLADELQFPCTANKNSRRLTDISKTPRRSWGRSNDHVILLRDEDDSLADDNTKNSAARRAMTVIGKLVKHILEKLLTSSDD